MHNLPIVSLIFHVYQILCSALKMDRKWDKPIELAKPPKQAIGAHTHRILITVKQSHRTGKVNNVLKKKI